MATIGCALITPSAAPAPQRRRLSASSMRRSAPVLAPRAARIASSPSRRTVRGRIRLGTLEQAMMETSAEAELNGFADDARIFPKSGGPETIGENDDAGRFGAIVLRPDETAKDRVEADYVEVVAADDAGLDLAGFTQADHGGTEGGEVTERGQGLYAGAQVLDFGHGECHVFVSDARSALADD